MTLNADNEEFALKHVFTSIAALILHLNFFKHARVISRTVDIIIRILDFYWLKFSRVLCLVQ